MRTLKAHQAGVAENVYVKDADGLNPGMSFKILQQSISYDVELVSKLDENSFLDRLTWAISYFVLMDIGKQPNS